MLLNLIHLALKTKSYLTIYIKTRFLQCLWLYEFIDMNGPLLFTLYSRWMWFHINPGIQPFSRGVAFFRLNEFIVTGTTTTQNPNVIRIVKDEHFLQVNWEIIGRTTLVQCAFNVHLHIQLKKARCINVSVFFTCILLIIEAKYSRYSK